MLNQIKNVVRGGSGEGGQSDVSSATSIGAGEGTTPGGRHPQIALDEDSLHVELREDVEIEMDEIFGILQNKRRRYVFKHLHNEDGQTTLSTLTDQIASWESGAEPSEVTAQQRKRVYVALYQSHLPKMGDTSAIEYDADEGTIRKGDHYSLFSHYLKQSSLPSAGPEDDSGFLNFGSVQLR